MPLSCTLAAASAAVATGGTRTVGWAQAPADHDAHRLEAALAAGMPMPAGSVSAPVARMVQQRERLQAMYDGMTPAKTPEQRGASRAEHMNAVQDGMAMMGGMGAGSRVGKDGMGAMGSMKNQPATVDTQGGMSGRKGMRGKGAMDGDTVMLHPLMDQRMPMMQMMIDRLPLENLESGMK